MSLRPPAPTIAPDYSRKWTIMLCVAMGIFLGTIDGSIVNVALPTLEESLNTRFATVQWVVVAYLLVITSLMLGVARLGDMIGKKRIYLGGMAIFTLGSALCGMAPTVGWLIGFRVVQAVGAVMMQALGFAIVTEAFPPSERGRALGMLGTVVSLGISIGPTLGGALIALAGWHAIFLVNLPVGVVGMLLVRRYVPDLRPSGGQRFDFAGALILLLTLMALALGLTFAPDTGWSDPRIIGLLVGALCGLAIFLWVEARIDQPMIDLAMFRDGLFTTGLLTGFLVFMVFSGMFVLPFYLERVKGLEPQQVGLYLTVIPVALGLTAPVAGALSDRYGSRGIAVIGLCVVLLGCLGASSLREDTSTLGYIVRLVPFGLGAGLFQSPNNSAIMGAAPRERLGVASGLLSLSRTFGQTTGIPLMGAIFASRVLSVTTLAAGQDASDGPPWAVVEGIHTTFLVGAGVIVVALVLAVNAFRTERRLKRARRQSAPVPGA